MNSLRILALKIEIVIYQVLLNHISRKYWLPLATKQLTANIALHILENKS